MTDRRSVVAVARCGSAYVPREAIARMFDEAPRDWWRFVPCGMCNSPRQVSCQSTLGPVPRPHASRYRAGLMLHSTLWLLANHPSDVLDSRETP